MQVEQTQTPTPMISKFDYMVRGWKKKTVYIKISNGVVLERTKYISPVWEEARNNQRERVMRSVNGSNIHAGGHTLKGGRYNNIHV